MKRILFVLFLLILPGCYHFPPPTVVSQANPAPYLGVKTFAVDPATFDGFTYDGVSEQDWLRTRDAKQVASWQQDKITINEKLEKQFNAEKNDDETFLFGGAGSAKFHIHINFDKYDGQFRWTAEIKDDSGKVIDVIRDPNAVTARFNTWLAEGSAAAVGSHMIVEYLRGRAFPQTAKN